MFRLLIDTSVWLDLAKDGQQHPVLQALEDLVSKGEVELLVPQTVLNEFERNKQRVLAESRKSMSTALRRARQVIQQAGTAPGRTKALRFLDDVDQRIPTLDEAAGSAVRRIEKLFAKATVLPATDEITLLAAKRAIDRRAPFHKDRNSIDDAVILETYIHATAPPGKRGVRFAFVTHNTKDFSDPVGDKRHPHPDLDVYFSKVRSIYFITLKDAVRRIAPSLLQNAIWEHEWSDDPRPIGEIGRAIEDLIHQIWYDRHSMRAEMIAKGKLKLVPRSEWSSESSSGVIVDDIWKGALKAAKEVERQFGKENLGPWTDFEWGMLNGKLSALRWVLGDEWDMLDT